MRIKTTKLTIKYTKLTVDIDSDNVHVSRVKTIYHQTGPFKTGDLKIPQKQVNNFHFLSNIQMYNDNKKSDYCTIGKIDK